MFEIFTKKKKLGWVNVFLEGDDRLRYGNYPKRTKKEALKVKSRNPAGRYIDTICIYTDT